MPLATIATPPARRDAIEPLAFLLAVGVLREVKHPVDRAVLHGLDRTLENVLVDFVAERHEQQVVRVLGGRL